VLVESDLPNMWSCATPVVPELGRKRRRKTPSLRSSTVPTRSMHIPVRDIRCSSRRNSPPSLVFSPPSALRGLGRENNLASYGVWLALLPPSRMFSCPLSFCRLFPTPPRSRCGRPYPPPVVQVVRGPPLRAVCRYDNPRHTA
jgi:hypothetical protein